MPPNALQKINVSVWVIEQHRDCSIYILVVVGHSGGFKYAYTGFVCSSGQAALEYSRLERFRHISPDLDSVDVAIAADMQVGKTIAERWAPHPAQHRTSEQPTRPPF